MPSPLDTAECARPRAQEPMNKSDAYYGISLALLLVLICTGCKSFPRKATYEDLQRRNQERREINNFLLPGQKILNPGEG